MITCVDMPAKLAPLMVLSRKGSTFGMFNPALPRRQLTISLLESVQRNSCIPVHASRWAAIMVGSIFAISIPPESVRAQAQVRGMLTTGMGDIAQPTIRNCFERRVKSAEIITFRG
jgi:hypothetical protein